jgi:3-isopropylmalate dehydrogenase
MAYQLVRCAQRFDVIAAPNMFGDILADLAAVHLGSRSHSFSGNFSPDGWGVYQTNHGAAYDLAGTDRANPAGQILSLAMMLRVSFGREQEAWAIEAGLRRVWEEGWRTADTALQGTKVVGTRELSSYVAEAAARCLESLRTD